MPIKSGQLYELSRSQALTFSRSHDLTLSRSHVLTFSRSHNFPECQEPYLWFIVNSVMKTLFLFLLTSALTTAIVAQTKTFHDFTAKDIDGNALKMSAFKGKKVLVVNVASECGNTPQYETLESMYKKYGSEKFVVIGFPANNFGAQEPGTNAEIKTFCSSKYQVTFPMMSKISVKGDDIDPLYTWLTSKSENGVMDAPVTWNFQKFMINEDGSLEGMVKPSVDPDCDKIIEWIEK